MSDSDSQTSQTSNQEDRRIGIDSGGVVATEGSTITLENIDPEIVIPAIQEAFAFSRDSLGVAGRAQTALTELVGRETQSDAATLAESALQLAVPVVVVAVAAVAFIGLRK